MATTFTKDQLVRVKTVVPSGPVQALRMDEDGTVFYKLTWVDINGSTQTRWFSENELEAA
jgi:hypothetical protein